MTAKAVIALWQESEQAIDKALFCKREISYGLYVWIPDSFIINIDIGLLYLLQVQII